MRKFFESITKDGVYTLDGIGADFESHMIVAAAYNHNGDIVTASGTVTIEAAPIKGQYHTSASGEPSVIDLSKAGVSATYEIPVFLGVVSSVKITVAGFSGADHIDCFVWSK